MLFEIFGASRILGHIFFTIFPLPFNREQSAVLRGRRDYYRNKNADRRSRVELRRNIHRLEKGLVMMPRRAVFAVDFIEETMEYYEAAARQFAAEPRSMDKSEIQWAHDVLEAYFAAVTQAHPVIDDGRARFSAAPWESGNAGMAPTPKSDRGKNEITLAQLRELARQRRSVRFFDQRPVEREKVDAAIEIAALAPTACNRMPYEFRLFDDPELVTQVAKLPFGTVGYSHQIPAIAVVVGKLENYFSPRDRHAFYVDASLATMSFLFALETQGLSSSVINWPDFEPLEHKMQKLLGLKLTERPVMLIAFGYEHPNTMVPYSQKKALDSLRSWNRFEL